MSNVVYLLIALGLSGAGLLVLWARNRPAASHPRSSVEEFNEKMRALAPDESPSRASDGSGQGD